MATSFCPGSSPRSPPLPFSQARCCWRPFRRRSCENRRAEFNKPRRHMPQIALSPSLLIADQWRDYQLLEVGDGMKCEKWGDYTLVRPDPQIIWPRRGGSTWTGWDAFYHRSDKGGGRWEYRRPLPDSWKIRYRNLSFQISPTNFKHTGLFPE